MALKLAGRLKRLERCVPRPPGERALALAASRAVMGEIMADPEAHAHAVDLAEAMECDGDGGGVGAWAVCTPALHRAPPGESVA